LAITEYDKILRRQPNDADALTNRGVVKFNKGAFREAEADFKQAIDIAPDDAYRWLYLWLARARQGNGDKTILTDFIEDYSGPPEDWTLLLVKSVAGKIEERELLAAAEGSSAAATGHRCEALFYGGEIALVRGDKKKAKELFEGAMDTKVFDFLNTPRRGPSWRACRSQRDRETLHPGAIPATRVGIVVVRAFGSLAAGSVPRSSIRAGRFRIHGTAPVRDHV